MLTVTLTGLTKSVKTKPGEKQLRTLKTNQLTNTSVKSQNVENTQDEQILLMLKNKSTFERGFGWLIREYQERLYWHVRRMVTEHEDANDVLQNVFMKVYRGIGNFKGDAQLYTWLYRIATNETITFLKKKQRRTTTSIDDEDMGLNNRLEADTYFDGNEAQQLLHRAIEVLPEKQRLVFNARYFDELPYKDMSNIFGTSVGALKSSYHHAVKKIERFIKENNG